MFKPFYKIEHTLSELVLFLPDYLWLNKQEGKERCNQVVKSPHCCHNVIILDVSVRTDGELTVGHLHLILDLAYTFILKEIQNGVVDHQLRYLENLYFKSRAYWVDRQRLHQIVKDNGKAVSSI